MTLLFPWRFLFFEYFLVYFCFCCCVPCIRCSWIIIIVGRVDFTFLIDFNRFWFIVFPWNFLMFLFAELSCIFCTSWIINDECLILMLILWIILKSSAKNSKLALPIWPQKIQKRPLKNRKQPQKIQNLNPLNTKAAPNRS